VNLLLDTCAFLWLAAEPDRLSLPARTAFDDVSNSLFLSDVSTWEIVLKHQTGKLSLPEAPRIWLPKQTTFFDLQRLPIDLESLFTSGELPAMHRDPFDRLLCATHHTWSYGTTGFPSSDSGHSRCGRLNLLHQEKAPGQWSRSVWSYHRAAESADELASAARGGRCVMLLSRLASVSPPPTT
jgi:PIN domain nuclease of toxin-antitoxin system